MYEKQTWKNGDVITEDKLNHIEDGIATGGGIYTYGEVAAFDGEVTTALNEVYAYAEITLQGELPKSDIHVTFNGQDYTLPYNNDYEGDYWGEVDSYCLPVFTNYPLFIGLNPDSTYMVATPEDGTYTLKIIGKDFELNDVFKNNFPKNLFVSIIPGEGSGKYTLDKTYSEINLAVLRGDNVRFLLHENSASTKEYYFDSNLNIGGSNWILYLFYVASYSGENAIFKYLEFRYTNSEGYPCNYDSSVS